MLYKVFGWSNVALMLIILAPYILRKASSFIPALKTTGGFKLQKSLRSVHKIAAVLLLLSVATHGWLILRGLRLHTGTIAGIALFITAFLGLLFYLRKRKELLNGHRIAALCAVLLVLIHLLIPNLLSRF